METDEQTGEEQVDARPPAEAEPSTESGRMAADDAEEHPEFAATGRGRILITIFILVALAVTFVMLMPASHIQNALLPLARPVLNATGLDQTWSVFAPNPEQDTTFVIARIERADGSVAERPIEMSSGLGEYRDYRWRKLAEQIWSDRNNVAAQAAYAHWFADRDRAEGFRPVRVTLLRRTRDNLPPGPGPDAGPWRDVPFFTATVVTS